MVGIEIAMISSFDLDCKVKKAVTRKETILTVLKLLKLESLDWQVCLPNYRLLDELSSWESLWILTIPHKLASDFFLFIFCVLCSWLIIEWDSLHWKISPQWNMTTKTVWLLSPFHQWCFSFCFKTSQNFLLTKNRFSEILILQNNFSRQMLIL